jgi:threonine synthase
MKEGMKDFSGGFATGAQTAEEIGRVYRETGYVLDTHTAVASHVYHAYVRESGDTTKTVIASTASPYKFAGSVMEAIDPSYKGMDDFALIDELSAISHTPIPRAIEEIRNAPVLHDKVIDKEEMAAAVKQFLGMNASER